MEKLFIPLPGFILMISQIHYIMGMIATSKNAYEH